MTSTLDRIARLLTARTKPIDAKPLKPAFPYIGSKTAIAAEVWRRFGDVKNSLADITEAKNNLGYTPEILFEEGLMKTIDWFKK